MNAKAIKRWGRGERILKISRKLPYCLLLLLVCHLAAVEYQTGQCLKLSRTPDDGLCELDSFSKPSIATAILKQEARRLFLACNDQQHELEEAAEVGLGSAHRPRQPGGRQPPGPGQAPSDGCSRAAALGVPAMQPLARLGQQTQELNIDLDGDLMVIYYRNRSWNACLDCYLQVLQGAPENPLVLSWAQTALAISESCRRTDEILDAMQHVTRFHRELKTARALTSMVEQWGIKNPRNFEMGAR